MSSFAPIRGTRAQLSPTVTPLVTPIIDGQFLIETDQGDESKIYADIDNGGTPQRIVVGGGGHEMKPNPSTNPTIADLVNEIKNPANGNQNKNVGSLWGIQNWSNHYTEKRIIFQNDSSNPSNDKIGTTGIGEWQDDPTGATVSDEISWGWYYNDALKLDSATFTAWGVSQDDIDINFLFDPSTSTNVPIVLGGYEWDTDTGYICIKFASELSASVIADLKIAIDIKITRTNTEIAT